MNGNRAFVLGVAACLTVAGAAGCTKKPLVFSSPDGNFTVTFPGSHTRVVTQKQTQETRYGSVTVTVEMATNNWSSVPLLMASHFEMPRGSHAGRTDPQILEESLKGAVGNIGGSISSKEEVVYEGCSAMEVVFEGKQQGKSLFGRARAYMCGQRLIMLMFAGPKKSCQESEKGIAFLKSFLLGGTP